MQKRVKRSEKKGVSPVIATVLLISISLVLALIIFLWARGFVKEKIQKFDGPIEFACDDIVFSVEGVLDEGKFYINNKGNVAIYGAEIRKKSLGSVKNVGILDSTLAKGEGGSFDFDFTNNNIEQGDEVIVVPIILGESGEFKKSHVCDEDIGEIITII